MTTPKRIVAGYIRVSSEPQAVEEKSSLDTKMQAILKWAKDNQMTLHAIYEDHATGTRADRTNYKRMKEDAKAGRFKKVLFLKWDRFGRNIREVLTAHDELKEIWVDIVCVSQNIDTSTSYGRYFMTNPAAFAELEWSQIRERTISGLKARAQVKGLILPHSMFPQNLVRRWKKQISILDKDSLESKLKGDRSRLGKLKSKRQDYWDMFNEGDFERDELKKQEGLLKGQIE